jgi:hypothetical protein
MTTASPSVGKFSSPVTSIFQPGIIFMIVLPQNEAILWIPFPFVYLSVKKERTAGTMQDR